MMSSIVDAAVRRGWMLALIGCTSAESATVTIGAAGPWSERYGAMNRHGIELAVDEVNARRLIPGRTLRLEARDDHASGADAAVIAQRFVSDPRIVAVVGHVNSGAMVAAAKVYHGQLPAVATTASSPDLSGVSPWVFRVISSDSVNGADLARFAGRLGRRRAAVLYENNSYGRGLAEAFVRAFAGEVVSSDPIDAGATDFEPFIAHFARFTRPDIVFVAGTERSGVQVMREARRQRFPADFLGGDGWTGMVVDSAAAEGVYVGAPFAASDPRPEAQRFVAAFEREYGMVPDGNAALAYDATMLVAQSIARAGTSRDRVRDDLAQAGRRHPFTGATGSIRFRPNGDPDGRGFVMTRVRSGALIVAEAK
jgi:branched-chain amino acid transport system substrate-binding protein